MSNSKQLGKEYIDSMLDPNGGMTEGGSRIFSPDGISDLALKHADALIEKLSSEEHS